jgi:hypothetical protein
MRKALALLGFVAATMLLLQPACAAYELAHFAADPDLPCCAEVQADAAAAPSDGVRAPEAASKAVPAPLALVSRAVSAPPPARLAVWAAPPPPPLPYHVRTARVLR